MKTSHKLFIGTILIVFALFAGGCSISIPEKKDKQGLLDTSTSFSGLNYLDQTPPRDEPEVFAPGLISVKGRFDMGFTISADGSAMAFGIVHESDPTQTNIQFLTRKKGTWSRPNSKLLPDNINTSLPMFGPQGKEFYYTKSVDGAENDLWMGSYNAGKVSNNHQLTPVVNSNKREAGHGKSAKGSFYFTSNRDDSQPCCGDVYRLKSTGNLESIEKIAALSSDSDEDGLYLSPEEDYIIIQAWKDEYQTKHDLYIAYRTAKGRWTRPERLNDKINSPEIEQRPFISPDSKYLFFSRMSIEQKESELLYESDVYWVSTSSIFKPYLYQTVNAFPVASDKKFTLQIPLDFFKDVDDQQLSYGVTLADGSPLPEHIVFDQKQMIITGDLKGKSSITLSIKVTDAYKNEASTYVELITKG